MYQYAVCNGEQLRTYDGDQGYVRWGRWVFVDPPLGGWTDATLPWSATRLMSLLDCRITVKDSEGCST